MDMNSNSWAVSGEGMDTQFYNELSDKHAPERSMEHAKKNTNAAGKKQPAQWRGNKVEACPKTLAQPLFAALAS